MKFILNIILLTIIFANDDLINVELLLNNGKYLEAKILYETITEQNENIFYIGYQVYYKLDDLNKSNELLQKAVKINEDKFADEGDKLGAFITQLKNAKITLDNGFVNESIEELNRLKEKYHENAIVHYRLGYAYKELKDYDLAIINFKQAKSLNPYNQDYINMITTLVKIQEANGHAEYQRQDYQLSLEYFNKALEYDSTYAPVMYRIGNIYYKIKDYEKAIEMYKKGLSYTEFAPNKYKTLNQLGKFYTKINNDEKALEVFDKVLDLEPDYEQALFEKAKIFKKTGKINDSKILLLKIIENNPAFVRSYELLMDIEKDLTNYDKAMSYGEKCLEFNKNSHTVLARMANTYNEINDFIKGREYAKSALKIKNKYGPALFELGYSEMNLCNKIAAKDAFSKAKLNKSYRKIANDYIKNLDSYMSECE